MMRAWVVVVAVLCSTALAGALSHSGGPAPHLPSVRARTALGNGGLNGRGRVCADTITAQLDREDVEGSRGQMTPEGRAIRSSASRSLLGVARSARTKKLQADALPVGWLRPGCDAVMFTVGRNDTVRIAREVIDYTAKRLEDAEVSAASAPPPQPTVQALVSPLDSLTSGELSVRGAGAAGPV
jgi:hypothetical protein